MNEQKLRPLGQRRYLGAYEYQKSLVETNPLFSLKDWQEAAKEGQTGVYTNALLKTKELNLDEFYRKYNLYYGNSDTRINALYNEAFGDKTTLKEYEIPLYNADGSFLYDENGKQQTKKVQMTEYDYNLKSLNAMNQMYKEKYEREAEIERRENQSQFIKTLGDIGVTLGYFVNAGLESIELLGDLSGALINEGGELLEQAITAPFVKKDSNWDFIEYLKGDESFAERLSRYSSNNLSKTVEYSLNELAYNASHFYTPEGEMTKVGEYIKGVADTIGAMIPSAMIAYFTAGIGTGLTTSAQLSGNLTSKLGTTLAKNAGLIGQTTFYAGNVFAQSVNEQYEYYNQLNVSVSSLDIVANSLVKTVLQKSIEDALGRLLGPSGLDQMFWGKSVKTNPSRLATKSFTLRAFGTLGKDMLQEGTEEALQEMSDWFVDAAHHFINHDFQKTEWSFQNIIDAFVIACITSFAGSAGRITVQSVGNKIKTGTAGVDTGILKTDKEGAAVKVGDTYATIKLNPIAAYQYGLDLQSYAENFEKLNEANSRLIEAQRQGVDEKTLNKMQSEYAAAYYQAVGSFEILSNLYGSMGEERFKKANDILTQIKIAQSSGTFDETLRSNAQAELITSISELKSSEVKKILKAKIKEAEITKAKDTVKRDEVSEDTDEEVKKIIEELESVSTVHVTEDGRMPVLVDDILLIPENLLKQGGDRVVIESIAEQKLADELAEGVYTKSKYLNNELSIVTSLWRQWSGDENATEKEAVYNLIFDTRFFEVVLAINEKSTSAFVLRLNKLVSLVSKKQNLENTILSKRISECRQRWIEAAYNFYSNNLEKDTTIFTKDFTKEEAKLFNERINKILTLYNFGFDIIRRPDKVKDEVWSFVERRIDNMNVEESLKNKYKLNIKDKDISVRQSTMNAINDYYDGAFYTLYNGKTYMPENSIGNCTLNNWLKQMGLTLKTLFNSEYITNDEISRYGDVSNLEDIQSMRQLQFNEIFPNMSINISQEGNVSVTVDGTESGFEAYAAFYNKERQNIKSGKDPIERSIVTELSSNSSWIKSLLKSELIKDDVHQFITINDLINHSEYLSAAVEESILNQYGLFDRPSIFRYLQASLISFSDGKKSLVIKSDGTVAIGNMTAMDEVRLKNVKYPKDGVHSISKFIKGRFLTGSLANIKVVFTKDKGTSYVDYAYDENGILVLTNTIYINTDIYKTDEEIGFALCHEFQHAIQTENRLNLGTSKILKYFNEKGKTEIIETVKKLEPKLFVNLKTKKEIENQVDNYIYSATGEYQAMGFGNYGETAFYPVLVSHNKGKTKITFRNGKSFEVPLKKNIIQVSRNISSDAASILKKHYSKYDVGRSTGFDEIMQTNRLKELFKKKIIDLTKDELVELLYCRLKPKMSFDEFKNSQIIGIEIDGEKYIVGNSEYIDTVVTDIVKYKKFKEDKIEVKLFTFMPKDIMLYKPDIGSSIGGKITINDSKLSNRQNVVVDLNKKAEIISTQSLIDETSFENIFDDDLEFKEMLNIDNDTTSFDTLMYNNKPFWIAKVNETTGEIVETWTYKEAEKHDFQLDHEAGYIFFTTDLLEDGRVLYDDFGNKLSDFLITEINNNLKTNELLRFALDYLKNVYGITEIVFGEQSLSDATFQKEKAPVETAEKTETTEAKKTNKATGKIIDKRPKSERKGDFKYNSKKYSHSRTPIVYSKNPTRIVSMKDIDKEVAEGKDLKRPRGGNYIYRKFVERRYYINALKEEAWEDIYDYYSERKQGDEGRRYTLTPEIEGTNLEYVTTKKGKRQITLSPGLRDFYKASTGIKLDPVIDNKIKSGTLKSKDLIDYIVLNSSKNIDNTTFHLICKYYFKNDLFKSPQEFDTIVNELGPKAMALNLVLKDNEDLKQLLDEDITIESINRIYDVVSSNETLAKELRKIEKGYQYTGSLRRFSETNPGEQIDSDLYDKLVRDRLLDDYDGSIRSVGMVMAQARVRYRRATHPNPSLRWQTRFTYNSNTKSLGESVGEGKSGDKLTLEDTMGEEDDFFTTVDMTEHDTRLRELTDASTGIGEKVFREIAKNVLNSDVENKPIFAQKAITSYKTNVEKLSEEQVYALYEALLNDLDDDTIAKIYYLAGISDNKESFLTDNEYTRKNNFKEKANKIVNTGGKVQGIKNQIKTIRKYVSKPSEIKILLEDNSDIFNNDLTLKESAYKTKKGYKSYDEILEVKERINLISKNAKNGVYESQSNYKNYLRKLDARQKTLDEILKYSKKTRGKIKFATASIETDDGTIKIGVKKDLEIPNAIRKILSVGLTHTGRSKIQELSEYHERYNEDGSMDKVYDDRYLKLTMTHLLRENAELLAELSEDEAVEILEFYISDNVIISDIDSQIVSETVRLVSAYLLGEARNPHDVSETTVFYRFKFDDALVKRVEAKMMEQVHMSAAMLSNQRTVIRLLQPAKIIGEQMMIDLGFKLDQTDESNLDDMITQMRVGSKAGYKRAKKKFEEKLIHDYPDKTNQSAIDKILTWERAMMLSNPGTWVRNYLSNYIVEGGNIASSKIGKHTSDLIMKVFPKKTKENFDAASAEQYKLGRKVSLNREVEKTQIVRKNGKIKTEKNIVYSIVGGDISENVVKYLNDKFIYSGLLDEIIDGVSKYDDGSRKPSSDNLVGMMAEAIASNIRKNQVFSEKSGKLGKFQEKGGKIANEILQLIYKGLNDDPWIKRQTLKYFAQIVEEDYERAKKRAKEKGKTLSYETYLKDDKTNIYGVSKHIASAFSKAVNLASYDYMKSPNFITRMERTLRENVPKSAWFMYKQVFPFLSSSWNWCVEGMRYTPAGLINAIFKFAKLENTISKMDNAHLEGKSIVSGEFAEYIQVRNIGKGIIGTIGLLIGGLLYGLGWAGLDEDDDEYKLYVGDVKININDVLGSQGVMLGVAIAQNIDADGKDIIDVFSEAFNQLFRDSIFQDFIDTFRYDSGFGDFAVSSLGDMPSQFLPNITKTIASIVHYRGVEYSNKPLERSLEKFLVRNIPLPAEWLGANTTVNPYTGNIESFSIGEFTANVFSKFSPVKINYPDITKNEAIAIGLGVSKNRLSGKYTVDGDSIELDSKELTKLNVLYGKLNKNDLTKFFNNAVRVKVKNDKGTYDELTYRQMTDKQKKAAIDNIMSNNGSISKIYILTSSDRYKYYASASEYDELRKLGITKNVYRQTKNVKGFVKS